MKGSAISPRVFVFCATLLALLATASFAQTGSAVVKGTVVDASHSIIPSAKVALTNLDTNIVRNAETSSVGAYYFPSNQPGRYSLTVEQTGFKKWTGSLILEVGQTAVVDVPMQVGATGTTIEVSAAVPLITTEGSAVADVKDDLRIHQIPLNGRTLQTLFDLAPGVEQAGTDGTGARVNGLKVGSVDMTVDGVSIQDRYSGNVVQIQPGLDTVQEFRTETTGSSARYARPATVTVVTKSGTNQLHGSLFETHRNNSGGLVARRRENLTNTSPELIRNEFGATAGGPLLIPKVYDGRNKTFWFFSYEGLRQHESMPAVGSVPTDAMWGGNLSNAMNANGQSYTIYDPLSTDAAGLRTPFSGNSIPGNRINNIAKVLQGITHGPTNSNNPYLATNLSTTYPVLTTTNTLTGKFDHRFSDKDNVSVRYTAGHRNYDITGGDPGAGFAAPGVNNAFGTFVRDNQDKNGNVTYNHFFSPSMFSETLLAVNRSMNHSGTAADFTNWADKLGMPNPFGANGWPTISIGGFFTMWDVQNPKQQNMTSYTAEENMTWIHGKHTVQFGGRLRHELNNVNQTQQSQGSHEFDSDWTGLYNPSADSQVPFTGDGFATMLLGAPSYLSAQYNRGYYYFRQSEIGLYVNDSFKITPRLTLDYGLRWDKWTPYSEKQNRLLNIDVANIATQFQVVTPAGHPMESLPGIPPSLLASYAARGLSWTTADKVSGMPGGLVPSSNGDFGPRVGLAFKINDKTTLRGGFGEFYWTTPLSLLLSQSRTDIPLNLRYTNVPDYDYATNSGTLGLRSVPTQFVGPNLKIPTQGLVPIQGNSQPFMAWDYSNWKDGVARNWNITLEREIFKDTVIRLSYIGNQGRNLEQQYDLNQREGWYNYVVRTGQSRPGNSDLLRPNPNWNPVAVNKSGYSNTNSGQFNLERRFSKGVAFQFFYVFTRSLTTADADAGSGGGANINGDARGFSVPQNNELLGEPNMTYDQRLRLGYSNNPSVPQHRVRWNAVLDLPFGRGRHFGNQMSKVLDAIVGGWSMTPAGSWRSGLYLTVTDDGNGDSLFQFGNPNLSADQRLTMNIFGVNQRMWFKGSFDPTQASNVDMAKLQQLMPVDSSQRTMRQLGLPGNGGWVELPLKNGGTTWAPLDAEGYYGLTSWNQRANIKGPSYWTADIGMNKTFNVGEHMKVQLKADAFNFLNHPCDINPNMYTGLQDLSQQANEPRILQFTARITF